MISIHCNSIQCTVSQVKEELYWCIISYNYEDAFIEHMSIGFIQTMVVFIINYKKSDYPHHVIIKHRAECADGIAKPAQWRHTHCFPMSRTSLALLSHRHVRHMVRCSISHGGENQILFNFLINTTMFRIKPMNMCSIITYVHNMKILIISIVLLQNEFNFIEVWQYSSWYRDGNSSTATHCDADAVNYEGTFGHFLKKCLF